MIAEPTAHRRDTTDRGEPLLRVRALRTYFDVDRGTLKAVDRVSFDLKRGRCVGVVGESGSGKTILSRSVLNLLPREGLAVFSGQVVLEGEDIRQFSSKEMRSVWGAKIGAVFQDPMTSLNPVLTIETQITEPLRTHLGLSREEARSKALGLLESVGIAEPAGRLRSYPHEFSGGMRQRITIAVALACDPVLLIADEPTTALDVTIQLQILRLLERERHRRDMGLIIISHDLGVIAQLADDVIVMYAGRVVETGPIREVFKHTRHPYTAALLESAPRLSAPSHAPLSTIPGRPPRLDRLPVGCKFAPRCERATDRCRNEDPPLEGGVHKFACFHPVGTPVTIDQGFNSGAST